MKEGKNGRDRKEGGREEGAKKKRKEIYIYELRQKLSKKYIT
jgi:hypothetical protein